jgi:hypothetical protein
MIKTVTNVLGCAFFHLLPKKYLERRLTRKLSPAGYRFHCRFSGRSALVELAAAIREKSTGTVALYPQYVCNIVTKALAAAHWIAEPYGLNGKLEADWDALAARIGRGNVGLLVGASIFGSSAQLDDLYDRRKLAALRASGTQVIVDLAQDVRLINKLPEHGNDIISSIASFNDKSFPGSMGGGIITNMQLEQKLNVLSNRRLIIALYKSYILKNIKNIKLYFCRDIKKKKADASKFDCSGCDRFPFRLSDSYRITKLQLACAVQGMLQLKQYSKAKRRLLNKDIHIETRYAPTAAYLLLNPTAAGCEEKRKRKRPYATENDHSISLRPNDAIIHNKGFDDIG